VHEGFRREMRASHPPEHLWLRRDKGFAALGSLLKLVAKSWRATDFRDIPVWNRSRERDASGDASVCPTELVELAQSPG